MTQLYQTNGLQVFLFHFFQSVHLNYLFFRYESQTDTETLKHSDADNFKL